MKDKRWLWWGLVGGLLVPQGAWAGPSAADALAQMSRGDTAGARRQYEELLSRNPSDSRLAFNAGVAAHQMGDWESAARHHEAALSSADLTLQQRAFFGLGSARFRQGEATEDGSEKARLWEDSARHFQAALGLNPADTDARANLETVREQLARLQREQQQQQKDGRQPNPPQNSGKQDKQDKQDKGAGSSKPESGKSKPEKDNAGKETSQSPPGSQDGPKEQQSNPSKGASPKDQDSGGRMEDKKEPGESGRKGQGGEERNGPEQGPAKAAQPSGSGDGKAAGGEMGAGQGEESVDGKMAVRFAERLLDAHKREERALIWSAPRSAKPDSRGTGGKTW